MLSREKKELSTELIYVVISMNQDEETAGAVASLAEGGNPVLWVIPVSSGDELDAAAVSGRTKEGFGSGGFSSGFWGNESPGRAAVFRWEMEG